MKASKWLFLLASLALIAVTACSKSEAENSGKKSKADSTGANGAAKKEDKAPELKAVPVEVTTIAAGEISSYVLTNAC
jgi:hypothetical protein